ncbi:MAG TPA: ABC transporter permease, partial [Segetibacter sp.]
MLRNFLKTATRNLWKNKTNTFLNVFGLAIGIACAGLIFLWAEDELGYNTVHAKRDRLYMVRENQQYESGLFTHSSTPGVMGPEMQKDIPGISATCRTSESLTSMLFTIGDKTIYSSGLYAEPSLFSMFTLPFVEGSAQQPFSQLNSLVLTEKAA